MECQHSREWRQEAGNPASRWHGTIDAHPWKSLPLATGTCGRHLLPPQQRVPKSWPCLPFFAGRHLCPTKGKNSRYSHLLSQTALQCKYRHMTQYWQMRYEGKTARELLGRTSFKTNKGANALFYSLSVSWEAHVTRNCGWPLAHRRWETEALLSQTSLEELNSANNQSELINGSFSSWAFK